MKRTKKIKAFTLAETLVTLMIIGVIAALTVPTIKDNSDEAKYVAAAKKAYSAASNATQAVEVRHTHSNFWSLTDSKVLKWYKEVLNEIPNPDPSQSSWAMVTVGGSSAGTFSPTFWTADGMAWQFKSSSNGCSKGGDILIDTNGAQQPNTVGIDIHGFIVGHKSCKASAFGVFAMGDGCNDTNSTYACTAYTIQQGKMPWFRDAGSYSSCSSFVGSSSNCPSF